LQNKSAQNIGDASTLITLPECNNCYSHTPRELMLWNPF